MAMSDAQREMVQRYHTWRVQVEDTLDAVENMLIDGHYITAGHAIEAVGRNVASMSTMLNAAVPKENQ